MYEHERHSSLLLTSYFMSSVRWGRNVLLKATPSKHISMYEHAPTLSNATELD